MHGNRPRRVEKSLSDRIYSDMKEREEGSVCIGKGMDGIDGCGHHPTDTLTISSLCMMSLCLLYSVIVGTI